jgi:RNA 2',3'-cyclic 3'-phosphodiesterase
VSSGQRLRLFVAADVPGDHLTRLQEATTELRSALPQARWTPEGNQHVTLKFLGATAPEQLPDVAGVCASVAASHQAAHVQLGALGGFPSMRRARVLWIAIEDPDSLLPRLAADLDRGFEALGFAAEERAYTPHLTLARMKSPAPVDGARFPGIAENAPIDIDHMTLYRSRVSSKGAVYESLDRFALA